MIKYTPVEVSKAAFAFCRYIVAILLLFAFLFKIKILVVLVFVIMLFSFIFKVQKAPLILTYNLLFGKLFKSDDVLINETSIRFAHGVGTLFSLIGVVWLYGFYEIGGWYYILGFTLLKVLSALGFCPAGKLYECTLNGNCCVRKKTC